MTTATTYEHIVVDDRGVAYIDNTTTKVIEVVMDYKAYGWSPEEIHLQHPYLTLGQIYSAFAYYWDHVEQLDRQIAKNYEEAERIRAETETSHIQDKLKAKGLL
jgi:uncharacterized protein (DUF433 family)